MRAGLLLAAAIAISANIALVGGLALNTPTRALAESYLKGNATSEASGVSAKGKEIADRVLAFGGLTLLVLFGVAATLYSLHALALKRRCHLIPMEADLDPALFKEMVELASRASVRMPSISTTRLLSGTGAQAFGFPRTYAIRLDGGLRVVWRKDREIVRAILLHEFAHIANGDVLWTYAAQALWVASLMVTFGGLALAVCAKLFDQPDGAVWNSLLSEIDRLIAVLPFVLGLAILVGAMVYLRASFLRTREFYADWRSALWGSEDALRDALRRNRDATLEDFPGLLAKLQLLLPLHPSSRERLLVLKNPTTLFRTSAGLAAATGFVAGMLATGLLVMVPFLMVNLQGAFHAGKTLTSFVPIAAEFFTAFLICGPLVLQVQRECIAELDGNGPKRPWFHLVGTAVLVSLGFEAGALAAPFQLMAPWRGSILLFLDRKSVV
jgi:Zn-dependent protease with chaperone function